MTRSRHSRLARRGFTLVELMVATALVVLILTILAVAFGAATESLSRLRSMGNMATDLRGAQDKLRADLDGEHFDSGDSPGILRLSDLHYERLTDPTVRTPLGGYFRIESGTGSIYEGTDGDGLLSTKATNHAIEFTSKRQGESADDLFVVPATTAGLLALNTSDTPLSGGQFVGKWARVRWHLGPQQTAGGVPVWTLYRSVRVVAPANVAGLSADEQELFAHTGGISRTLAELTNPVNRPLANIGIYPNTSPRYGDDIVLSNVTSFEVKPTWDAPGTGTPREPRGTIIPFNANRQLPATAIGSPIDDTFGTVVNGDAPFDDLPRNPLTTGPRVFDTGSPTNTVNTVPLRIRVTAVQVKIRVFDPKTLLSRQVSFIVQP